MDLQRLYENKSAHFFFFVFGEHVYNCQQFRAFVFAYFYQLFQIATTAILLSPRMCIFVTKCNEMDLCRFCGLPSVIRLFLPVTLLFFVGVSSLFYRCFLLLAVFSQFLTKNTNIF